MMSLVRAYFIVGGIFAASAFITAEVLTFPYPTALIVSLVGGCATLVALRHWKLISPTRE
jgi:hypothetical protein